MVQIKSEKQYKAACERINELLKVVNNDTPADDKNMLELDLISDLVADYEEEHYPIAAPTLVETMKLRMYGMGFTWSKTLLINYTVMVDFPLPHHQLVSE